MKVTDTITITFTVSIGNFYDSVQDKQGEDGIQMK